MKNRIEKMKAGRSCRRMAAGKLAAGVATAFVLFTVLWCLKTSRVFAYNFVRGGAEETGTVTVSARSGPGQVNGYSTLGGYRITYTVTREEWTGFDDRFGGFFVVGNDMDTGGGCQFAYHTSGGEIWEDGAVTLGYLRDGRQIARCDVASGTVSCSFDVDSLEEIPGYIAYVYEPTSSAYLHINADMGMNAHVWFYKSLRNVPVIKNDSIDTEGPVLTASVLPTGATAGINGKVWSTGARIQVRAEDGKSRPGAIRIYKDGNRVHEKDNPGNEVILETGYDVTENGSFQADAHDKLNNTSDKITVDISCIDRQAPVISSLKQESGDYVRETRIFAEASDAGCGLHAAAYSWNGGAWTDQKEFRVAQNGIYTVKVRDALGNESSRSLTVSNIDREGPEITRKIVRTGKMATSGGVLWSTEAEISAEAVDGKSGVNRIRILNDKGKAEAELQNTGDQNRDKLKLEKIKIKNGSYKIWASDFLGNTAVTESIEVDHVDGEAPVIEEIKTTSLEDGSILLTAVAKDEGIGLDDTAYSFDGGRTWQKEAFVAVRENGVCRILVRDKLYQEVSAQKRITEVSIKEKTDPDKGHGNEEDKKSDKEEPGDKEPGGGNEEEPGNQNTKEPEKEKPEEPEKEDPGQPEEPGNDGNGREEPNVPPAENPGNPANVTPGANTQPGQNIPRMLGNVSKNRKKEKTEPLQKEKTENSVSKNGTSDTVVTKKHVIPEKVLKDAEEKVLSGISSGESLKGDKDSGKEEQKIRGTILIVLGVLFAAGCIGLLLYMLLFYLRYSCVLYGIADDQKKQRICRLFVREKDEEWQVSVPDHRLGLHGTGRYLLVFHPSFIKEEEESFVIIQIDGKALREKLKREISISI